MTICKTCVVVALAMLSGILPVLSQTNILFSETFAANNCVDVQPDCTNSGTGSTQNNNCVNVNTQLVSCKNIGDGSTQNNNCVDIKSVGGFFARCGNAGEGSIQNNNCIGVSSNGCNNIGDGSTQNNNCVRMSAECDNFGKGSIQDNNCIDFPLGQTGCRNSGDGSTQNNICTNINDACDNSGSGGSQKNICSNIGSQDQGCWTNGDSSTQTNICANTPSDFERGCEINGGNGSPDKVQSNTCVGTNCLTQDFRPIENTQVTKCANAGGTEDRCLNTGDHTTVIGTVPCKSGSPHTITICVPGKTIVRPD